MLSGYERTVTRRGGALIAVVAAWSILGTGMAEAQRERGRLEVDVADCVEIESPAERFRCYESRVDAALGGAASAETAPAASTETAPAARAETAPAASAATTPAAAAEPAPAPAASAARPSATAARPVESLPAVTAERVIEPAPNADDSFGLPPPREERVRQERETQEFYGTVASVRETLPNQYIITLENGHVWRQTRPSFYPLRPGHRVRIYSTQWGSSYRMTAEELNGFIQVQRIQ